MLDAWAPHRCVIVDLRGRGASDAPERGYTVDDHVGDLDAVVADARIGPVHLVAYSRGTTYALAWALEHPDSVLSLTVGDYRAEQIVPPDGWASWWMSTSWRGIPMTERMQPHVVHEVARDVTAISYWSRLAELPCPVLVIRPTAGAFWMTLRSNSGADTAPTWKSWSSTALITTSSPTINSASSGRGSIASRAVEVRGDGDHR